MSEDSLASTLLAFAFCGAGLVVLKLIIFLALKERPDPVTRFRGFEVLPPPDRKP